MFGAACADVLELWHDVSSHLLNDLWTFWHFSWPRGLKTAPSPRGERRRKWETHVWRYTHTQRHTRTTSVDFTRISFNQQRNDIFCRMKFAPDLITTKATWKVWHGKRLTSQKFQCGCVPPVPSKVESRVDFLTMRSTWNANCEKTKTIIQSRKKNPGTFCPDWPWNSPWSPYPSANRGPAAHYLCPAEISALHAGTTCLKQKASPPPPPAQILSNLLSKGVEDAQIRWKWQGLTRTLFKRISRWLEVAQFSFPKYFFKK